MPRIGRPTGKRIPTMTSWACFERRSRLASDSRTRAGYRSARRNAEMQAKLFDPFSEDAVSAWLAETPVKVVHSASVFDTTLDGHARQVALVFYEDEQAMGNDARAGDGASSKTSLAILLDPLRGDSTRK